MRFLYVLFILLLSGCSTHPLQKDVTGLSTYQIVHKIRCEARETIEALFHEEGLEPKRAGESDLAQKAEKYQDEQTDLEKEVARLQAVKDQLDLDAEGLPIQYKTMQTLVAQIKDLQAKPPTPQTKSELIDLFKKLEPLATDYQKRRDSYPGRLADYEQGNLEVRRKKLAVAQLVTDLNKSKGKGYKDIVQFYGTGLVYNLRFKVTENNDATAGGSLVWPISIGTITLGYDVGEKRERSAEREIKLVTSFGDLLIKTKCGEPDHREVRRYPIAGRVGLDEVIRQYWKLQKDSRFKVAGESYRDTLLFTTTDNGSITPEYSFAPLGSGLKTISGEATLGAKRSDIHELIVFLFPLVPDKLAPPTRVQIVNTDRPPHINVTVETKVTEPPVAMSDTSPNAGVTP